MVHSLPQPVSGGWSGNGCVATFTRGSGGQSIAFPPGVPHKGNEVSDNLRSSTRRIEVVFRQRNANLPCDWSVREFRVAACQIVR